LRIGTKAPGGHGPSELRLNWSAFEALPSPVGQHPRHHPDELTPEMSQACRRLADAGIPLGSQTVLLSGINDDVTTMKQLVHGLLRLRIKPYYLYQLIQFPAPLISERP